MIKTLVFYSRVILKDVKNDIKTVLKAPSLANLMANMKWNVSVMSCFMALWDVGLLLSKADHSLESLIRVKWNWVNPSSVFLKFVHLQRFSHYVGHTYTLRPWQLLCSFTVHDLTKEFFFWRRQIASELISW